MFGSGHLRTVLIGGVLMWGRGWADGSLSINWTSDLGTILDEIGGMWYIGPNGKDDSWVSVCGDRWV